MVEANPDCYAKNNHPRRRLERESIAGERVGTKRMVLRRATPTDFHSGAEPSYWTAGRAECERIVINRDGIALLKAILTSPAKVLCRLASLN